MHLTPWHGPWPTLGERFANLAFTTAGLQERYRLALQPHRRQHPGQIGASINSDAAVIMMVIGLGRVTVDHMVLEGAR